MCILMFSLFQAGNCSSPPSLALIRMTETHLGHLSQDECTVILINRYIVLPSSECTNWAQEQNLNQAWGCSFVIFNLNLSLTTFLHCFFPCFSSTCVCEPSAICKCKSSLNFGSSCFLLLTQTSNMQLFLLAIPLCYSLQSFFMHTPGILSEVIIHSVKSAVLCYSEFSSGRLFFFCSFFF